MVDSRAFPQLRASLALLLAVGLVGCAAETASEEEESSSESAIRAHATTPGLALSVHTTLGIPEAASPDDPRHALLVKRQYVTSFDSEKKNPRWTSWELTTSWLGSASRSSGFVKDALLPANMPQAANRDYTNSGFQRGHLCPSADRTLSASDNAATFVFTNAVPQTAESNTRTWATLEDAERTLARAGNHLFVVAGSLYETNRTIGNGVAVPSSMFKVVVVLRGAHPTPSDVTASTRVIAVEIPNTTTVSGNYRGYLTSIADLETKTGFRFLSDVPATIHDALAPVVDDADKP